MTSNQYLNKNETISYIDIFNSNVYSDDAKNPFIRQTKDSFNYFSYSLSSSIQNKKGNEISLNQNKKNNIRNKTFPTKKNLSIDFKILKTNSLIGKNKIDFSLLKKAKEICLKIKKKKLEQLKINNEDLNMVSYDLNKSYQTENIKYYSPIKKTSFYDYNRINNIKLEYKKKSKLLINNYQGKNLMKLFNKTKNNKDKINIFKDFSPNYIKNKLQLKKISKKASISSRNNNIRLKLLNINYSNKFNINNINNEKINKSTNFVRKPVITYKKENIFKNLDNNYKPKNKLKKSLSFNYTKNISLCNINFNNNNCI